MTVVATIIQPHMGGAGKPHDHNAGPGAGTSSISLWTPPAMSASDTISAMSAFGTLLAAIFAFASLRQVAKLAMITQVRGTRLATLQVMQAQANSIGFLSKPPENAAQKRADRVAHEIGELHNLQDEEIVNLASNIYRGKLVDIPLQILESHLVKISDWSCIDKDEHSSFVKLFNTLEEISTSVIREAIDIESVRKMYGSLILMSYREFSQWIYMQRRLFTYHYFDQFDLLVDSLNDLEDLRYNLSYIPNRITLFKVWLTRRNVFDVLNRHTNTDGSLSDRVLELALARYGQIDEHRKLRQRLTVESRLILQRSETSPAGKRTWTFSEKVGFRRKNNVFLVQEREWLSSTDAIIYVNEFQFDLRKIVDELIVRVVSEDYFVKTDDDGCRVFNTVICIGNDWNVNPLDKFRFMIRAVKREFNAIYARPFFLILEAVRYHMTSTQEILFSEGGRLVALKQANGRLAGVWLF